MRSKYIKQTHYSSCIIHHECFTFFKSIQTTHAQCNLLIVIKMVMGGLFLRHSTLIYR